MNSQLIKKNAIIGGYTKVYPLAYIQGIKDEDTGENLQEILAQFNHVYLDYQGDIPSTRKSLPEELRRKGIWITYNTNSEIITEMYLGGDIHEDLSWERVPSLEFIMSNASKIPNEAIIPEHLSPALWEMLLEEHTIINMPDDEDLTHNCRVLKFKDRKYCDSDPQGKGYKILRREWVDGINVLYATELQDSNTIYEIRYDFYLKGAKLELPEDCTLLFNGGTINDGSVVCNGTNILGITKFSDAGTAIFTGTFCKGLVMAMDNTIKWYDGTEWKQIEGTSSGSEEPGGGEIDLSNIKASVANVSSTATAMAEVNVEDNELKFSFGLPKGDKGEKGSPFTYDDFTIEQLEGLRGPKGDTGERGAKGEKGEKGDPGDVAISSRSFTIFKSTGDSEVAPATPVGGTWNAATDVFTSPSGWTLSDHLDGIIWISIGVFLSTGAQSGVWSAPQRITGASGLDGVDGVNIEFIYRLTKTLENPGKPDSQNINDYVPTDWTDQPSGIDPSYPVEWVCTRKKKDGIWSEWDGPSIWSKWGSNGKDGDGVEYIFKRNNGEAITDILTPDDYLTNTAYQTPEYLPNSTWTDDPKGVSEAYLYEWVSQRKYRDGKWQAFSTPAVWAKYGEAGSNGRDAIILKILYAKYPINLGAPPVEEANAVNPGSIWGAAFPTYDTATEAVWKIQAWFRYNNTFATINEDGVAEEGWQGPYIVTGVPGKTGTPPNWKTFVFTASEIYPSTPDTVSYRTPFDSGGYHWIDAPDDTSSTWWMSVGDVDGVKDEVTQWSDPIKVTGQDGIAQDGKRTAFRFTAVPSDRILTESDRIENNINPSTSSVTWVEDSVVAKEGEATWMIWAIINPDGQTLYKYWSKPIRVSGERGPIGATGPVGEKGDPGPQGISGIPGVSIEVRYCLGTETTYDGVQDPQGDTPSNWLNTVPTITEEKPYIWCIQGRRVYSSSDDRIGTIAWYPPFRLSGINGLNGTNGKKGQIVYPAGIYDVKASYTTDEYKAPYVWDPSYDHFYILNAIMTWKGTNQNGRTPGDDYKDNGGKYWMQMETIDAIYSKVGVIANGLIGSAVFNGVYMFSQQGINPAAGNVFTKHFENFNPDHVYDGTFTPNILYNMKTGEGHMATGKIKFTADSLDVTGTVNATSGKIGNFDIKEGNLYNTDGQARMRLSANGDFNTKGIDISTSNGSLYGSEVVRIYNLTDGKGMSISVNGDTTYSDYSTNPDVALGIIGTGEALGIDCRGSKGNFIRATGDDSKNYMNAFTTSVNNTGGSSTSYYSVLKNQDVILAYANPVLPLSSSCPGKIYWIFPMANIRTYVQKGDRIRTSYNRVSTSSSTYDISYGRAEAYIAVSTGYEWYFHGSIAY